MATLQPGIAVKLPPPPAAPLPPKVENWNVS